MKLPSIPEGIFAGILIPIIIYLLTNDVIYTLFFTMVLLISKIAVNVSLYADTDDDKYVYSAVYYIHYIITSTTILSLILLMEIYR